MNLIAPVLPDNAPFTQSQRQWLNGYLAALGQNLAVAPGAATNTKPESNGRLLFLFGTQTGSSEGLAKKLAKSARGQGFETEVKGLDAHESVRWEEEKRIVIITSTYGDGEMPDNAQAFWSRFNSDAAPSLTGVSYSVLALGDTNYTKFCEAGKLIDARLEALGGNRVHARVDCDVDYDEPSRTWISGVLSSIGGGEASAKADEDSGKDEEQSWSKSKPYPARLQTNRKLNGDGSAKDTRHIEINLGDSGLVYQAGDALGVMPSNCPAFVEEILAAAGLDGYGEVAVPGGSRMSVAEALRGHYDLKPFLNELPAAGTSADQLVAPLKKLQPRLYSISSSPNAHPGEVHLTVGVVRYELNGRKVSGVCSTFLADRVSDEVMVPVFVHSSPGFRPPANPDVPMIMVGPGTGIAPFRAFLEEREETKAGGRNWLLFGDQKSSCDSLYADQIDGWLASGLLSRFDTAFSRDQAGKIYVQDRMRENAAELWQWLESGAHFYVCGDASRMAKDVDTALRDVIQSQGGLDAAAADAYLAKMKADKRYCRDVY